MRKLIPLFILCLVALNSQGQWVSQATGFTTATRGIGQIIITDNNTAWATAYDGSVPVDVIQEYTRTTDDGTTWVPGAVTSPANREWSCFTAIDDQTAWAMFYNSTSATKGYIYKTSDGGQTWSQQGSTLFQSATSFGNVIYFWDANTGVAMGDPPSGEFEIYTTSDGGANWNAVDAANIPDALSGEYGLVRGLAVGSDGAIWFLTNMGRVYKSTDQGQTWTAYDTGLTGQIEVVACKDANNAWVRQAGSMARTTDGGATWNTITPASGHFFKNDLCFVPTTADVIISTGVNMSDVTDQGSSYSLDGGDNWVTIDSAVQRIAVKFFNNGTGWCGGFSTDQYTDGIFKYTGGFVAVGIQNSPPTEFKFNLYPNPGDGLFYFSFDVQNTQPIHIRVTDALGKTVFDKIYKDKSQTWLRSIDLRSFSKGIYFLDLENNGNHTARKLVVN